MKPLLNRSHGRLLAFYGGLLAAVWPVYYRPLAAIDFWKQIYTGRYLVYFARLPHHATFTFSPAVEAGFREAQNWLGNVIFYYSYWLGGVNGLLLGRLLLLVGALILLHSCLNLRTTTFTFLILVTFAYGVYSKLLMRNTIVLIIALPLLGWILVRSQKIPRLYWTLPPLLVLWGNIHASAYLGLALITAGFGGSWIDRKLRGQTPETRRLLSVLLVLILALIFVKPMPDQNVQSSLLNGLKATGIVHGEPASNPDDLIKKSLGSVPERVSAYSTLITGHEDGRFPRTHFNRRQSWEWSHPLGSWNLFFTIINFGVGLLGIGLFLLSGPDLRLRALFPFLLVLSLGLLVLRFTPFITLFGWFMLVDQIKVARSRPVLNVSRHPLVPRGLLTLTLLALLLYSTGYRRQLTRYTGLFFPHYQSDQYRYRQLGSSVGWGMGKRFRSELPRSLVRRFPEQKMVNSYAIGGFLIWHWWPYKKVFVDSKLSGYDRSFVRKLFDPGHNKHRYYLEKDLHHAIYEKNHPWIRRYLRPSEQWQPTLRAGSLVLYSRRNRPTMPDWGP